MKKPVNLETGEFPTLPILFAVKGYYADAQSVRSRDDVPFFRFSPCTIASDRKFDTRGIECFYQTGAWFRVDQKKLSRGILAKAPCRTSDKAKKAKKAA